MFVMFDLTQLVTLAYLVIDPDRGLIEMVNAGHPPPVIIRAGGAVELLPTGSTCRRTA